MTCRSTLSSTTSQTAQTPRRKRAHGKRSWSRKGERALFNSVELDKEDIEMNKKYLFAIESGRQIIAKGKITLRGEPPGTRARSVRGRYEKKE